MRDAHRNWWYRGLGPVAALALVAACGSSTGPGLLHQSFELHQLNNADLPYDHEGLGCCTYLAGELQVEAREYTFSLTAHNRNTGEVFTAVEYGKVDQHGSGLTFAFDSFAPIPLGLTDGTVRGDTLRANFGGEGQGAPDQFHGLFVHGP